jgi:hypothetical protein
MRTSIPQDIMKKKKSKQQLANPILQITRNKAPTFSFLHQCTTYKHKTKQTNTHYFEQHMINILMKNHIAPSTDDLGQKIVNHFHF